MPKRLETIDVVRGSAVVAMIHIHVVGAFGNGDAKQGWYYALSDFFGGGAAPIFLALAGLSGALTLEARGRGSGLAWRGLEIWALGLLFRVQEWALGGEGARSTSLLRVDVLNCIGVSLILVAALFALASRLGLGAKGRMALFLFGALGVLSATPIVRASNPSSWLPRPLAFYLTGPRELALFPVFAWTAMALLGAALGVYARGDFGRGSAPSADERLRRGARVALASWVLLLSARLLWPAGLGFVRNDPNPIFSLERSLLSLGLLAPTAWLFAHAPAHAALLPLSRLGRHSLLIYWVHVELAYGLWFFAWHGRLGPLGTTLASASMLAAMVALALIGRHLSAFIERSVGFFSFQRPVQCPAEGSVQRPD